MAPTMQIYSLICFLRGGTQFYILEVMFAKIFCKHEVVCIGVQDMIKFGHSTREYVLLHAQSNA